MGEVRHLPHVDWPNKPGAKDTQTPAEGQDTDHLGHALKEWLPIANTIVQKLLSREDLENRVRLLETALAQRKLWRLRNITERIHREGEAAAVSKADSSDLIELLERLHRRRGQLAPPS